MGVGKWRLFETKLGHKAILEHELSSVGRTDYFLTGFFPQQGGRVDGSGLHVSKLAGTSNALIF